MDSLTVPQALPEEIVPAADSSAGMDLDEGALTTDALADLALDLLAGPNLADLARRAVRALILLLPGRGVHLQLWSRTVAGGIVEASGGPEMSTELHGHALCQGALQVGEIVVDRLDQAGRAWSRAEEQVLQRVARLVARAAVRAEAQAAEEEGLAALLRLLARLCGERLHVARVERSARLCAVLAHEASSALDAIGQTQDYSCQLRDAVRLAGTRHLLEPDALCFVARATSSAEQMLVSECALRVSALCGQAHTESKDERFHLAQQILECLGERYDGSGPRALAGDALPLAARIYAVAQAWLEGEASGASHLRRLQALRERAGSSFDPNLVEMLARLPERALA